MINKQDKNYKQDVSKMIHEVMRYDLNPKDQEPKWIWFNRFQSKSVKYTI